MKLGYHGDTSATFFCGDVDDEAKNLVQVTKECLDKAISICAPGVEYKQIGKIIHDHADRHRYGVVEQFVGHGVGRVFHADPVILHYRNNGHGRMMLNQTFTIGLETTKAVISHLSLSLLMASLSLSWLN
ncbi:unnamed protein product [Thlaspi arvense]|uniref:Peptidase M24 domain-containing protein n=1 Tax=Thlaspi arvense TaxID=13288 RepID=A0AAU9SYJ4_THLAR|nr:unnamed protein product [Thlaspi arvense]